MKISVIIPVYNVEDYLEKCVESALRQDLEEYEILLVNDGSTDGSYEIAKRLQREHPERIRVLSQENRGLGGARNTGIENARGEYLFFLDSDDYIRENALPRLYGEITERGADILIFDAQMVDEQGRDLGLCLGCRNLRVFNLEEYPALLWELPGAWNKLYRRSLFLDHQIRYPDKVWYEDIRTTLKLYLYAKRITAVREVFYYYLQREGSIMQSNRCGKVLEMCDAIQEIVDYYKACGVYGTYRTELMHMAFLHEFMWSIRRVNLADWRSPVQDRLREHFQKNFPDYRQSAFFAELDRNDRIFVKLIEGGHYLVLHGIYRYSDRKKEWRRRKNGKK